MCTFAALAVAGTGLSAAGRLIQGRQEEALAEYQARAIEQEAELDRRATGFEMAREIRKFQGFQGSAIAKAGASGVALQGSPSEALTANAAEHALDLEAIRYGSQVRTNKLKTQADISRFQGRQSRTASYIGAATNAISGLSNLYDPSRAVRFGPSRFARAPAYNPFA